jgi:hypothetical protein
VSKLFGRAVGKRAHSLRDGCEMLSIGILRSDRSMALRYVLGNDGVAVKNFKIARVSRVPSPKNSTSVPPLAIPEFTASYSNSRSTTSGAWRCRAFSSASASTNSDSVNTSGGLKMLGGVQSVGCCTATSSRFAAPWASPRHRHAYASVIHSQPPHISCMPTTAR